MQSASSPHACKATRVSQRLGSPLGSAGPLQAAAPLSPRCRRHLQQGRRRMQRVHASTEEDLDQQLQADLERLRQRQQAAAPSTPSRPAAAAQQAAAASSGSEGGGPLAGAKDAVDKLLIADFFFILFALAWLGAALVQRSTTQSTSLLDTWLSLWQWVFQPAIGVLMLGALVSGAVGWAKENLGSQR